MKTLSMYVLTFLLIGSYFAADAQELRKKIENSVLELKEEFSEISDDKTVILDQLASKMVNATRAGSSMVVFIDESNNEISQQAMIWFNAGLLHYGLNNKLGAASAGVNVIEKALNLKGLKKYGFKLKVGEDGPIYTYLVGYNTNGAWEIRRKDLESLNLDDKGSIKVFVEEDLTDRNAEILFDDTNSIPREMIYVVTKVNSLLKIPKNN